MRIEKFTFEMCKEIALKYDNKTDFRKYDTVAYSKSVKNHWVDQICSHMKVKKVTKGHWTFENCKNEALKYNTRYEFAKNKSWCYQIALRNNWLDDICKHMLIKGNLKKRCIYAYEFPNNVVYVGLTHDINERWVRRLKDNNDIVKQYIDLTNEIPIKKQLSDYVDIQSAIKLENKYLNEYLSNNWVALNRNKTGSLGGDIIFWTKEKCVDEVSKYNTLSEFRAKNINCLSAIYKNNWGDILSPLIKTKKENNYWGKEKCIEKIKLCNSRLEFYKKYRGAYASSKRNGWFNEIINELGKRL